MRSGSIGTTRPGKIDGVSALQGFAVELGARAHIAGDIGDRDRHHEAVGILRIGYRMDGVVMVASVRRVDRDKRQVRPILAVRHVGRRRGVRGLKHGAREDVRDAVFFKRDQADGLFARDVAEPLDDAAGGKAEAIASRHFNRDKLAVMRALGRVGRDGKLLIAPADRNDPRLAVASDGRFRASRAADAPGA